MPGDNTFDGDEKNMAPERDSGNARMPRILLLDDESEIVDSCARTLKKHYLVVKTNSPFEAVSFMDVGRHMIDLVICDYTMPGMNGEEFLDKIRSLKITTPVILFSGRIPGGQTKGFSKFVRFIEKPFSGEKLLNEVASVLASIERETETYKKFRGVASHLDTSLKYLEDYLIGKGIERPMDTSLAQALKILGHGEAYNIFLSWHHLQALRSKIGPKDLA